MIRSFRATLGAARYDRAECSGALGDLGTFLPLLLAMSTLNGLDFTASLFFAGVFSVLTACMFRTPMAVQPMKAIAAAAIAHGLTSSEIVLAGAMVSLVVLTLGVLNAIAIIQRIIPRAVVRGMQGALGVTLLLSAGTLALRGAGVADMSGVLIPSSWTSSEGLGITLGALIIAALTLRFHRFPAALVLFASGLALAAGSSSSAVAALAPHWEIPAWNPPDFAAWPGALFDAALPQIPLTTLNSVISVCALAVALYPGEPEKHASPRALAVSVGSMNLIGMWFGAMPMCHGAGGLAAQHRFGARTNGAILMLGVAKIALAVIFGASLLPLCKAFPRSILAAMLAISAVELLRASLAGIRQERTYREPLQYGFTLTACLLFNYLAIGVLCGAVLAWCMALQTRKQSTSA